MDRKRTLVTGGSGFIGSHLCQRLLDMGHDVLAADNFYSSDRHNVHELLRNPRFELIRHDVTFALYVEVDEIYHLACPASPVYYQRDPVQTTKTCVHGSINMLGLAKRLGARILLTSTSEVYGDPAVHPQSESYWGNVNPIGIRSCYDEGKRAAETLFFDYHRQHGLPIKVARIENAARRRPGGIELHRAGPQRRAAHRLRRRLADQVVLLHRRHGGRPDQPHELAAGGDRADQPRQSWRVHDDRAG
jgi:UDP-glucuronate decarboxylase